MNVDLLKPGTVPISPDTVLGFEFLLDKELLHKHLQKPNPDPSPTDLITKFHDVVAMTLRNQTTLVEPDSVEGLEGGGDSKIKHPAKNIAMKILSLKVAAYLNWNLDQLRSLPFKTQINLLQDLMYFTSEEKVVWEVPNFEQPEVGTAPPQLRFALLLYHRWLLNTAMNRVTSNWQQRFALNEMYLSDESVICTPDNVQKSITFLTQALQWDQIPFMLTFDCFQMPTEQNDSIEFHWSNGRTVTKQEFCAQICYDLGTFFFYREEYEAAKLHFRQTYQYVQNGDRSSHFITFDSRVLEVYMNACDPTLESHQKTLLEQLNISIVNQFTGITNVLQQDNLRKEIPLAHRINLELDIQGAISSGVFTVARDLLYKVKALNYVRCILDQKFLNEFSLSPGKNVDAFMWAVQLNWKRHTENDRKVIKEFLIQLLVKEEIPDILDRLKSVNLLSELFTKGEMQFLVKKEMVIADVPQVLVGPEQSFFDSGRKRKPKMELRQLTKQLMNSYDWKEIKDLLTKIGMMNLGINISEVNPQWELPIPLQSVVKSLPRGLLHDLSYTLLAKSKEQLQTKNWNLALELLIVLDKELQTTTINVTKLTKMINWEVMLVQITELLEEWPRSSVDKSALANACEVCLQTNESVLPRTEIVEHCALYLLNMARWEFLLGYEKRRTTFEVMSSVAATCHDMIKHKGVKKFSKDLWDIVLPVFAPNPTKRGAASYNLDVANLKNSLMMVFLRLRDARCLTVVVSMLTKLYNIFRDEPSMELQVECMNLWPATVSNASSYSIGAVSEILSEVLRMGLKYYPTNVPWLRLMGDINYANGNYKISLSFYLKSLIICYDYFNIPIRYDDHVFRRMIKCCQALGCSTQAAVLCQFLEEPDYSLAFRILGEQKPCNDAVDAYYHCFWDTNILEYLIHMHNRRGEFQRRKCAIQVMGMLELNSNNNEEIQREASNLRKSVFLRALCKQYVF